jgi:hypothetical protein
MPPTYSPENLTEIAKTVGLSADDLAPFESQFEDAAVWYRLTQNSPKRLSPFKLRQRLISISKNAKKLLKNLSINNPENTLNGTIDPTVLAVLTSHDGPGEDDVLQAADRMARLYEMVSIANAASDIEKWAEVAKVRAIPVRKRITLPGHVGELATNYWIGDMMDIYQKLTGRKPATSTDPKSRPKAGKVTGPLVPFLAAAAKPLGLEMSPDAWRKRVRTISKYKTAQK